MQKNKIGAMTMVRNDSFFLAKWIAYYGKQLGEENLYIYLDGKDQPIPDFRGGTNITCCERVAGNVVKSDKARVAFLSAEARRLMTEEGYDMMIGTDVDEFIVVDPQIGMSLKEYMSGMKRYPTVSALGLDVGQNMKLETEIRTDLPFLNQRHFALVSSRYTKSSIITRPLDWGSGFHRVRGYNYHIDPNLYLFHFGCIDMQMLEKRVGDGERIARGWKRHLHKRSRVIRIVTGSKAVSGDKILSFARTIQTYCRPIFALNKPTMYGWKLVVEIPERFRNIL